MNSFALVVSILLGLALLALFCWCIECAFYRYMKYKEGNKK